MLCRLADAVDALRAVGIKPHRLWHIGGAAASAAVPHVAATLADLDIYVPWPAEYVARGAAWMLGGGVRPQWAPPVVHTVPPAPQPDVRDNYAAARAQAYG